MRREHRPWSKETKRVSHLPPSVPTDNRSTHVCGAPERTWVEFKDYKPEVGQDDVLIWFGFYKTARVCTYKGWDEKEGFPIYETDNPEFMGLHPYYWMWYNSPPRKFMVMSWTVGSPTEEE